jgi:hypothetical protein
MLNVLLKCQKLNECKINCAILHYILYIIEVHLWKKEKMENKNLSCEKLKMTFKLLKIQVRILLYKILVFLCVFLQILFCDIKKTKSAKNRIYLEEI